MESRRWDPFEDSVPDGRDPFRPHPLGRWERKHKVAGAIGVFGLLAWIALPFFGIEILNWIGFVLVFASGFWIALDLDPDEIPIGDPRRDTINALHKVAAQTAGIEQWGLALIQPPTCWQLPQDLIENGRPTVRMRQAAEAALRRKGRRALLSDRQIADLNGRSFSRSVDGDRMIYLVDRRIYPLETDLTAMVMPSPVVAVPLPVQAVFRWQHREVPFWTGIAAMKGDLRNPLMSRGVDRRADVATLYPIFAFPLARKTGVHAHLRAAFPYIEGDDAKLDSATFNQLYTISHDRGSQNNGDETALYRVFTPAAQSLLIDLFERYGAEIAIRDEIAFVRLSITALMTEDEAKLTNAAEEWHSKLTLIADDLVRLKTYLE
ncbi:hypothetical protein [Fulvimarina sp. MAC8]|uniref:hypothetical protein n=1 Tax=Fulvimarina sp. MAC8 TaxID=3162874 RepID=UPI0032EC4A6A